MENKWTRGPWMVTPSGYRVMWVDKTPPGEATDSGVICDTATNQKTRTRENAANAKLIAKAPEMAALLLKLFNDESAMCELPASTVTEIKELLREAGAL